MKWVQSEEKMLTYNTHADDRSLSINEPKGSGNTRLTPATTVFRGVGQITV